MTLLELVEIYGGGPGSGCNPQAGKCGRTAIGVHEDLSDRAKRALMSYNPMTQAKYMLAKKNERAVAKAVNGLTTANNSPFDVVVNNKIGIEVKTVVTGKNDKITMHPESLARKKEALKKQKLKKAYTVVIDVRGQKPIWYVKPGLRSFRFTGLEKLNSPQGLRKVIPSK